MAARTTRANGNGSHGTGSKTLSPGTLAPIDLDDLLAAAAEADAVPYPFTFRGHDYSFPHPTRWPIDTQKLLMEQDFPAVLARLLGEENAKQLVEDGLAMGHVDALLRAVMKSAGLGDDLGNSSASLPPGTTRT